MKALVSGDADDGLVVAATSSIPDSGEPGDIPIRLSRVKCADHIEIVGESDDFHVDTMLGILRGGVAAGWGAILLNTTGDPAHSIKMKDIAVEHGRGQDFRFVDLGRLSADVVLKLPKFDGRSSGVLDTNGSHDMSWKFHQTLALDGVLGVLIWLRDRGEAILDAQTISRHAGLLGMIDMVDMARHMPPWVIRHRLRLALELIPQGLRHQSGFKQSMESVHLHAAMMAGVVEMISTAGELPEKTYSFPGRRPLMLDAIRAGNIVAIDIPRSGEWNNLGAELARRVFEDVVESMKSEAKGPGLRPDCGGVYAGRRRYPLN